MALLARRETVLEEKAAAIALLSSSLVEAPEDNVSSSDNVCECVCVQISSLQRLLVFCCEKEAEVACSVRKMALASLAAVFKDIAPRWEVLVTN